MTEDAGRTWLMRLARPALRHAALPVFRLVRGMTLGVRGVVLEEGRVLLVRHTYVPGWHFPGGGVDAGETLRAALERELREEANVRLTEPASLHGLFRNARASPRDHVAVFVVRAFEQAGAFRPNAEISEARWWPLEALPEALSPGTRARLREVLDGAPAADDW